MSADTPVTAAVKRYALQELNVDLVGVANIERFAHAPARMSPQGIMPSARSVVVMAIHHPDAAVELGGLTHPQEIGPYCVQYDMNTYLDEMSYRMGLFLEDQGYRAVPIVSSNIWRYKGYKELTEQFAPDMSHLHAAVAAGLSEFGYSGLSITPEYGARQRYVSVITDAPLTPSPLLEPGTVCDNCMLCRTHCMSGALSLEIDGWNEVAIEDKTYRYAKKNLWRCSWGEHFDLDLDLPIPEKVDEQVILDMVEKHGVRRGEMGSCLRHCLPADKRLFDPDYTNAPRRKSEVTPASPVAPRTLVERVHAVAARRHCDACLVVPAEGDFLPHARSAILCTVLLRDSQCHGSMRKAAEDTVHVAAYHVARELERAGYPSVSRTDAPVPALGNIPEGFVTVTSVVLTEAALPATGLALPDREYGEGDLRAFLLAHGADVVGVADAGMLGELAQQLRPHFDGCRVIDARDRSGKGCVYDPEISERIRVLTTPEDLLPGARSVVVVGMRIPEAAIDACARYDAEAVGPYSFAQYESVNRLAVLGRAAMAVCEARGIRAAWSFDLLGSGSFTANPRGPQPDVFANRFAAWAAGLTQITRAGFPATTNMRYLALVLDAELPADTPLAGQPEACRGCERCIGACHTEAFGAAVQTPAGTLHMVDPLRCDWAKRYSLIAEEGCAYLGWDLHVDVPATVTPESLGDGLRQQPPISKSRPCNFEACLLACPLARTQADG